MRFYKSDWSEIYQRCVNHHIAPICEISNDSIDNFLRYNGNSWFHVNISLSFGRGMQIYLSDRAEFFKYFVNCHIAPLCEISNDSMKNCLRYNEKSWFYVDFNHSFGRGMLFYRPIDLIVERNRAIIIIHHPAKFHWNRSRTFWDNRTIHTQTDRHTHRHIHADENNTCPKSKILGQVKRVGEVCMFYLRSSSIR